MERERFATFLVSLALGRVVMACAWCRGFFTLTSNQTHAAAEVPGLEFLCNRCEAEQALARDMEE